MVKLVIFKREGVINIIKSIKFQEQIVCFCFDVINILVLRNIHLLR
jgi:hypothetical protein